MSDASASLNPGIYPMPSEFSGSAAVLTPSAETRSNHRVTHGVLKARRDLPLLCNPIALFILNWTFMLTTISVQITYVTYPYPGIPILICGISLISFLLGLGVGRMTFRRPNSKDESLAYTLDLTTLTRLNLLLCGASILIIVFNWVLSGPPPALGDPGSYLTYGRFKQVLFPMLVCVTVNSMLETSRIRRIFFACFGIGALVIYITRGLLLIAFLQMLFVFTLKSGIRKRTLYAIAFGFAILAVAGATLFGNARTAQDVFLEYLQIRQKYFGWNTAFLWFVSYISIPFSNLCWIIAKLPFHGPTLAFLYPLLPSFLTPLDPHAGIHDDLSIIDGASTYLAAYALDFSYLGIYLANLVLGLGCGWLVERALPKQILVSAILLACLSFIFFSDMFTPLSTIIQIIIQASIQRRCFRWKDQLAVPGALP